MLSQRSGSDSSDLGFYSIGCPHRYCAGLDLAVTDTQIFDIFVSYGSKAVSDHCKVDSASNLVTTRKEFCARSPVSSRP
jgi:hypothetical protein